MQPQKYILTDIQIKNLLVFLGRVSLKGDEVAAFSEIITSVNSPVSDPKLDISKFSSKELMDELEKRKLDEMTKSKGNKKK